MGRSSGSSRSSAARQPRVRPAAPRPSASRRSLASSRPAHRACRVPAAGARISFASSSSALAPLRSRRVTCASRELEPRLHREPRHRVGQARRQAAGRSVSWRAPRPSGPWRSRARALAAKLDARRRVAVEPSSDEQSDRASSAASRAHGRARREQHAPARATTWSGRAPRRPPAARDSRSARSSSPSSMCAAPFRPTPRACHRPRRRARRARPRSESIGRAVAAHRGAHTAQAVGAGSGIAAARPPPASSAAARRCRAARGPRAPDRDRRIPLEHLASSKLEPPRPAARAPAADDRHGDRARGCGRRGRCCRPRARSRASTRDRPAPRTSRPRAR